MSMSTRVGGRRAAEDGEGRTTRITDEGGGGTVLKQESEENDTQGRSEVDDMSQ